MLNLIVLLLVALAALVLLAVAALIHQLRHPPRKTFAAALARDLPTDPADLGLTAEAVTFELQDRRSTPGWIVTGHRMDGPTVVFVHGFGDSRYGALTWTDLLLPYASSVVFFDQRGQGESDSPASTGGIAEIQDLRGIIERQLPDTTRPIVLFGCSLGANTAIAAAVDATRVRGVVADSPYRFWDEPVRAIFSARRYPAWPIIPLAGLWLRLTMGRRGFPFDRAQDAARLRCPLLVLHSTDDALCPYASAQAIADAASHGRIVAFEQADHLELATADPARYRDALTAFFDELPQDPPA